ncbi:MAG: hypothetical protein IKV82_06675 [Akkermansia sp.]|nr:hypothetical protein [Akkermansia sp.]
MNSPCPRVNTPSGLQQSPPSHDTTTLGEPPPRQRPTSACPISCDSRQKNPTTTNMETLSHCGAASTPKKLPNTANISNTAGCTFTETPNNEKRIIGGYSKVLRRSMASPHRIIRPNMSEKK